MKENEKKFKFNFGFNYPKSPKWLAKLVYWLILSLGVVVIFAGLYINGFVEWITTWAVIIAVYALFKWAENNKD